MMRSVMDSSLPSGLTNLGNTCFANATIQIILHIPHLQEYINKHEVCNIRIVLIYMIII